MSKPTGQQCCIQKAWDGLVTLVSANQLSCILSRTSSDTDKARLLAASSPHTGDWLHAPLIASVGLQLSDEAVRVAVAHRLGCKACEPHLCVWKAVSAHSPRPGMLQKWSKTRHQSHSQLNDILWRAFKRAVIPAVDTGALKIIRDRLQRVLNAAAHVVSDTQKFDSGLLRLMHTEMHWLDVPERVQYKLGGLMYRCQHNRAPPYLTDRPLHTNI